MGRCRFVSPDSVRLPLSDGEWIDVVKRLNVAQSRKVFARLVKEMKMGSPVTLDPEQVGRSKVSVYLLGWSLTDAAGKAVPVSDHAIDSLDSDTFREILDAIEKHEDAQDAEALAEKNATAGESN